MSVVHPWNDPHIIRRVLEANVNHADVFVRTTLAKRADGYVPGEELWQEYRLWAHRTPMSESSFLAALEKVGHSISYGDDHEWFLDGWCYPGTKSASLTGKDVLGTDRPAARQYKFTRETLDRDKLSDIALLCQDFNGIAEAIGWPARKFAIYRTSFPRVAKAIEKVWRDNPDRFKPEVNTDTNGKTRAEKTMMIACARRALIGARARGNEKQIASAQARLKKLQGKG